MRLKHLRSRQVTFSIVSGLLLASFVAAQTLPLVRSAALPQGAAVAPTPTPAATPAAAVQRKQSKRRDLSQYAKAGPFNLAADEAGRAQAHAFLLEHWRGRRLGHLSVSATDPEGRQTVSDFFVEPDGGGQWCVVLETPGGPETFRVVEEIDVPDAGPPVLGDRGARRRRPSGRKGLHLKQSPGSNNGLVF